MEFNSKGQKLNMYCLCTWSTSILRVQENFGADVKLTFDIYPYSTGNFVL